MGRLLQSPPSRTDRKAGDFSRRMKGIGKNNRFKQTIINRSKKMKNKSLIVLLAITMLFGFTTTVIASAPTITIYPMGPLFFSSFPQTVDVNFKVDHDDANVTALTDFTLFVNDVLEAGPSNLTAGLGNVFTAELSLPWEITGPGTYTLMVSARHGGSTGSDTEVVIVQTTVVVDYPAAPAIAARLLRENGVSGSARGYYVSMVALYMGPQTDFDGVAKSDAAAYEEAVDAFLMANGAY